MRVCGCYRDAGTATGFVEYCKTRYARRGACGAASASVAAGCVVGGRVEYDCVSDASLLSPNLHAFTPTFPTQTLTHMTDNIASHQA